MAHLTDGTPLLPPVGGLGVGAGGGGAPPLVVAPQLPFGAEPGSITGWMLASMHDITEQMGRRFTRLARLPVVADAGYATAQQHPIEELWSSESDGVGGGYTAGYWRTNGEKGFTCLASGERGFARLVNSATKQQKHARHDSSINPLEASFWVHEVFPRPIICPPSA